MTARHRRPDRHPFVRHLRAVVHRKPAAPEAETALPPREPQGDAEHQPNLSEMRAQFLRREDAFLARNAALADQLDAARRENRQLRQELEERTAARAAEANAHRYYVPAPMNDPESAWFRDPKAETPGSAWAADSHLYFNTARTAWRPPEQPDRETPTETTLQLRKVPDRAPALGGAA